MTVASDRPSFESYISDGASAPRAIAFPFTSPADIFVTVGGAPRTLNTHYTISGTYPTATINPLNGFANSGDQVIYWRDTPPANNYSIVGPSLSATALEQALDRQVMVAQEARRDIERSMRVPLGEAGAELPSVTARANKFAAFDSSGALTALAAAPGLIGAPAIIVRSRIIMANQADPEDGQGLWLSERGRSGMFEWQLGDFTSAVAADPLQILYVPSVQSGYGVSTGCWVRVLLDQWLRPEWGGAIINDSSKRAVNLAAINACLALGNTLLSAGSYYVNGAVLMRRGYTSLCGVGRDISVIFSNSTTGHIVDVSGATGSTYIERPILRDFSVAREVLYDTPPNTEEGRVQDRSQAHGIHLKRTSNAVVEHINSTDSLMNYYWADALSFFGNDLFSFITRGDTSTRHYGFYGDGTNADTPPPFNGFPSPNPVFRLFNARMSNASSAGEVHGCYLYALRTDLRIDGMETAGCHFSATLEGSGSNVWLQNFWLDAFKNFGMRILSDGQESRTNVRDFYAAPASGATGEAFYTQDAENIVLSGEITSPAGASDARSGIRCENGKRIRLDVTVFNHDVGAELNNCQGITGECRYVKFSGTGSAVFKVTGGSQNRLAPVLIPQAGSVLVTDAIRATGTSHNSYDLSGVDATAATNKLRVDGVAVTTQGNVGNDVVINPGAGAML